MNKKKKGRLGEDLALRFLVRNNYKILQQNYYSRWGEIDLIVWDRELEELVFVEVKTRSSNKFGYPEEAVDGVKFKRIVKTANIYLQKVGYHKNYRFDCVSVELDYSTRKAKITHFKNI